MTDKISLKPTRPRQDLSKKIFNTPIIVVNISALHQIKFRCLNI
jgi:hypothetical protein